MSNFITNQPEKILKSRLNTLISVSNELKFLVGFFYFSGVQELYESLKRNDNFTLKILVGLGVDQLNGQIFENTYENLTSDHEIVELYLKSVKQAINTDEFDSKVFNEQVDFFINLIIQNRIIIRKTSFPNHAKLYLFKLNDTQVGRKNIFITGSSNLTKAGVLSQDEFNVEISDYGFEEAEKYFDNLWETSIPLTEDAILKDTLINIIYESTHLKKVTPFEAYCFTLKSYLDEFENKIELPIDIILEKSGYKSFSYQIDAVKQALSVIEKHRGVIIADVVGLGKTVIASAIAKSLNKRGIVIAPPGLVGDENNKSGWRKYLEDFELYDWSVRSLGKLEETLEFVKERGDIEVVIVDEVHRFRNQDTKDYDLLQNICRGKIVILLTATPFNNKPSDIFALIKLFITPKKSSITIENNIDSIFRVLENTFKDLTYIKRYFNHPDIKKQENALKKYKRIYNSDIIDLNTVNNDIKSISKNIKTILEPIIIRRNRIDLKRNEKYKKEIKTLSEVKDPIEWYFELNDEQNDFYDKIITEYFADAELNGKFRGAIYRPYEYEEGLIETEHLDGTKIEKLLDFQQQRNLFDFMRRLVVRRFESSFGAFKKTVENFKRVHEIVLEFVNKTGKYILDRDLIEKIYEMDSDEIEAHLVEYKNNILNGVYPKKHKIYEVSKFKNKNFLKHISEDIMLFESVLEDIEALKLVHSDPKTKCIIDNIKISLEKEPKRKIIIFSEFVDTVKYLEPVFSNTFNNKVLVVAGNISNNKIDEIYQNFDASYKTQKDDYLILLCTDKISEGFNLNRAGMVINYDIPWNPVRVIQRLGRINRIGKKVFESLYIVNFFPTKKGGDIVQSREIAQNKMFMIHNTLGEDAKIFDESEEVSPSMLFDKVMANPEAMEEESFYTKVYNKFSEIKKLYPEVVEKVKTFPTRVKTAKQFTEDNLIVFMRKNALYAMVYDYTNSELKITSFEDVFDKVEVDYDEKRLELSDKFWDAYDSIRNYKEKNIMGTSAQSIEKKAYNVINYALKTKNEMFRPLKKFLSTLKNDLTNYGTLSDYTLRRIANLENKKDDVIANELEVLKNELGEDYLSEESKKSHSLKKEIIIAIENIAPPIT
ncbi:MAG: Superfamily helicase [Deferribacteraceae bacterium]|nr:Superfamily helicase [Deferribacteraceae bacterium]